MSQALSIPFDAATLLQGIRRWVEIESPTTDAAAVNRMMDQAMQDATTAGARVQRIAGRDSFGDHLLVAAPWDDRRPGILVLSHLDTVHPIGTLAGKLSFRVDGDVAYGPGIADMKGGAYIALSALSHLIREGEPAALPIRHLFVSDEEVGSPTSRELIKREARRAKYVLVTEPAREGGKIVTARKGAARFTLYVTGRPSHSGSRHQEGRSAVKELARQIVDLEEMTDYATGVTVNVGLIQGGTRANVVPAEAWAEIDMRVPDPQLAETAVAKVRGLKPYDPDVGLTVRGGLNRPPYEKSEGIARLFEHARALAAEIGFDLQDLKTGGGSDGNFTASIAPTLDGLGVDGTGGHSYHEQLYVSSLVPRTMLLLRLFQSLR